MINKNSMSPLCPSPPRFPHRFACYRSSLPTLPWSVLGRNTIPWIVCSCVSSLGRGMALISSGSVVPTNGRNAGGFCVFRECTSKNLDLIVKEKGLAPVFSIEWQQNVPKCFVTFGRGARWITLHSLFIIPLPPCPLLLISGQTEQQLIGAFTLTYSINKLDAEKVFEIDFGASVCPDGEECIFDIDIIEDYRVPIPLCNSNFSFSLPGKHVWIVFMFWNSF